MKKIIYIGNHLKSANPTTLNLLSQLLMTNGFQVEVYSNQQNKLLRFMHMCWGVLTNCKANFILIDTYSTFNFYYALVISQLARVLKIAYIPILHGGNLPKRLINNPTLCDLIFKNAYINIAPSNYLLAEFQKRGYTTQFIPNAIELKKYTLKKRNTIEPKLLWVRAFDAIYNPLMAVDVLRILKKTYPNATLCMVGADKDGSLEKIKRYLIEKALEEAIEFTGLLRKEDWIEKSKEFDIFINTTTIDNTPVSVIEAMALGLPVVSTNVGGIPFLIKKGETGSLVASTDAQEMAKNIIALLEHPEIALKMCTNARAMVSEFDVNNVRKQWIQLLK